MSAEEVVIDESTGRKKARCIDCGALVVVHARGRCKGCDQVFLRRQALKYLSDEDVATLRAWTGNQRAILSRRPVVLREALAAR